MLVLYCYLAVLANFVGCQCNKNIKSYNLKNFQVPTKTAHFPHLIRLYLPTKQTCLFCTKIENLFTKNMSRTLTLDKDRKADKSIQQ